MTLASGSRVIAIDGPAASGKSSTAAAVAGAIGFVHIDSGALYRALTWISVEERLDTETEIIAAAERRAVSLRLAGNTLVLLIDGVENVEEAIRTTAVNASVSTVAAMPAVRDWVNLQIRHLLNTLPGAVIDGRDIGSVVVPDARLKVFLTATPEARAERRLRQRGAEVDPAQLAVEAAALADRDRRDSSRAVAPLLQPSDAHLLDSTGLSFQGQVDQIVRWADLSGLLTPDRARIF